MAVILTSRNKLYRAYIAGNCYNPCSLLIKSSETYVFDAFALGKDLLGCDPSMELRKVLGVPLQGHPNTTNKNEGVQVELSQEHSIGSVQIVYNEDDAENYADKTKETRVEHAVAVKVRFPQQLRNWFVKLEKTKQSTQYILWEPALIGEPNKPFFFWDDEHADNERTLLLSHPDIWDELAVREAYCTTPNWLEDASALVQKIFPGLGNVKIDVINDIQEGHTRFIRYQDTLPVPAKNAGRDIDMLVSFALMVSFAKNRKEPILRQNLKTPVYILWDRPNHWMDINLVVSAIRVAEDWIGNNPVSIGVLFA